MRERVVMPVAAFKSVARAFVYAAFERPSARILGCHKVVELNNAFALSEFVNVGIAFVENYLITRGRKRFAVRLSSRYAYINAFFARFERLGFIFVLESFRRFVEPFSANTAGEVLYFDNGCVFRPVREFFARVVIFLPAAGSSAEQGRAA